MRRWAFNVAAGMSLVMCMATAAIWMRSFWRWDSTAYRTVSGAAICLDVRNGRIVLFYSPNWFRNGGVSTGFLTWLNREPQELSSYLSERAGAQRVLGFQWGTTDYSTRTSPGAGPEYWFIGIPCWVFVVGCLLIHCILRGLHRKKPEGFCAFCGYDLRATPDRCPECGAAAARGTKEPLPSPGVPGEGTGSGHSASAN